MNIFLIVILSVVAEYTIAYFLTRIAIIKCDSMDDVLTLHIFFFIPIVNIVVPLITLLMSIGTYEFFKIKN